MENQGINEQVKFLEQIPVDDHEHIVDVTSPEVRRKIEEAKELFWSFFEKYVEEFDLSDPEKRQMVFGMAERMGVFQKAREIRKLIFGRNISLYGVCYLSNKCDQNCKFCPMGQMNYEKWRDEFYIAEVEQGMKKRDPQGINKEDFIDYNYIEEEVKPELARLEKRFKTATLEEASQDIGAIVDIGHQEICILSGEEISFDPTKVVEYVQIALDKPGVKEVILNMGSYTEDVFKWIKENLRIPTGVKLQHRVFQETYVRDEYDYYLERSGPKEFAGGKVNKRDFDYRYNSQVNALKAGFDEVGIGALFGLTRFPLREIAGLQQHTKDILEQGGKEPKRCCLPFANQPEKEHPVDIKYAVPGLKDEQKIIELIYALARLAMPTVSIVSSERDNPETLKTLDQYANHSTLFVHPAPCENIMAIEELAADKKHDEEAPVGQAEVFSRKPLEALKDWKRRGYNILDFDVSKYI